MILNPKFSRKPIKVVGCGLAGAEIALILARHGFDVHIFDNGNNKPKTVFPYYNSHEKHMIENMKFELDCLNSPILSISKKMGLETFGSEYDENFMLAVKKELENNPKIQIFKSNIVKLNPFETTVIATGHNTDENLLKEIENIVGKMRVCHFQPQKMIIDAKSVKLEKLNFVSETVCYANVTEAEYDLLYDKILKYDGNYESLQNNDSCTVEILAKKGKDFLKNGVLRPHFDQKCKAYASLKMTYNKYFASLVLEDFYSALDEEEQKDIVQSISAFAECQILQFSKVLKRTFLVAPSCLNPDMKIAENTYVCGGFAGTAGSFEGLLTANYCAYSLIGALQNKFGAQLLTQNTCIGKILANLLKNNVLKFRLFNLNYDIIDEEGLKVFEEKVIKQKSFSKTQTEKFKEKFYGKYF